MLLPPLLRHFPHRWLVTSPATPHHDRNGCAARRPVKFGACHRHDPVPQEDSADQVFVGIRVDAYHQVVPLFHHIDGAVLGRDLKPDIAVLHGELGRKLAHRGLREEQWRTHPQPSTRLVSTRGDRCACLIDLGEQHGGLLEQRPPFFGELERACSPLEEPQIEATFQVGHPARQGCLGAP